MRPLTNLHRQMILDLVEAGHGVLDTSGRICIGPIKSPIPGDAQAWLVLVCQGLVAGENDMMIPTEAGRQWVAGHGEGRIRESRGQ